jgi:hypothetical protein
MCEGVDISRCVSGAVARLKEGSPSHPELSTNFCGAPLNSGATAPVPLAQSILQLRELDPER